jgi:ABC-type nickel/cobalt efflux system permease component RcnA
VPNNALSILLTLYLTLAAWSVLASNVLPGAAPQEATAQLQAEPGALDRAVAWVWTKQREFHRSLTSELGDIGKKEGSAWLLVLISFIYGVFHAAGPGHGKAILTTYLLTHGREVSRGMAMASATALMQGVTAVVLVYGLILAAGWLPREARTAVDWTERFSFLLVIAIGLFLLWRGARSTWRSLRKPSVSEQPREDQDTVQSQQIKKAKSWRAILGVVLAVGLRPCSGAVLILIFAHVMQIHWAGIAAVLAMSIGTAITVSTLALLAVNARHWALAFTKHGASRWWGVSGGAIILLGGVLITTIGLSLLIYSFGPKHPLGL